MTQDRCTAEPLIVGPTRERTSEDGYSLLEVLIGLAIVASLTAIVAPRLTGHLDRSKTVSTKAQAKQLKASMTMLQFDLGRYPTKEEGLDLLVKPLSAGERWNGPYLDGAVPLDAWSYPFQYEPPQSDSVFAGPRVYSLGADNAPGGSGLDTDIEG